MTIAGLDQPSTSGVLLLFTLGREPDAESVEKIGGKAESLASAAGSAIATF